MDLIVVESPTKAKTLAKFLGSGFSILATMGHIRDLPERKLGIKIVKSEKLKVVSYEFLPEYVLMPKKEASIKALQAEAKKAEKIYLATDPDREGEAIAWHTAQILGGTPSRITFHEITKTAIEKALASPSGINLPLVDAQQARRILDRLVGYKLSPLLWFKIRRGLSAGRVQSVAVRLIVEREREIEKFAPVEYWEIFADLRRHVGGRKVGVPTFLAQLAKVNGQTANITSQVEAEPAIEELKEAIYEVGSVDKKEVSQNPGPPFTTSTLQQRAVQKLGFSSKRTMRAAQGLYEKGLITYHRTDSLNLATEAVQAIRLHINNVYGEKYLPAETRFYKTKSRVAQEAHEAIRPTNMESKSESIESNDEAKVYDLIWKRTIASQMSSAIWDQTKIEVRAASRKNIYLLTADGKVIKFDGYLKVYGGVKDSPDQLPELKVADDLDLVKLLPEQKFTSPPARYNEASLIKTLEELGIGRPSTYAPIVSTIQDRQYVEKLEGKFSPTALGTTVNDFLMEYFPDIFDYQFTAKMEDELDNIARGRLSWQPVVADFWGPFEKKLSGVSKVAERVSVPTELTGEKCPQCEKEGLPAGRRGQLVIRIGRFGKFISCSRFPDCKYTAPLVQKLEGKKCPKCGGEVAVRKSKKGKQFYGCANWPKCDWASWRKPK